MQRVGKKLCPQPQLPMRDSPLLSCFVNVLKINMRVLKVKACRNSHHGFPIPLAECYSVKGCEKGVGKSPL